jgi:hypothetical protein
VTRDRDGQTIVTQDGRSTDITIQGDRADAALGPDGRRATPQTERFERPSTLEGVRSRYPGTPGVPDGMPDASGSRQDAFRARILERMR